MRTCRGDSGAPVVSDATNAAYGLARSAILDETGCGALRSLRGPRMLRTNRGSRSSRGALLKEMKRAQSLRGQYEDQWLVSPNLDYKAVMQKDGNFVLYGPNGAIWSSATSSAGDDLRVIMQSDGNLVIYTLGGTAACSTGTAPNGSIIKMQDDGNLVICSSGGTALWHRGPNERTPGC